MPHPQLWMVVHSSTAVFEYVDGKSTFTFSIPKSLKNKFKNHNFRSKNDYFLQDILRNSDKTSSTPV